MRIIDLENINYAMRNETQFVLHCEEVFHDKVSAAAAAILTGGQRQAHVVALTGPSGSGKTTTAMRLRDYLENLGVKVCLLSMDNFFLPLEQRPPEATDWESPYCVNVAAADLLHQPAARRARGGHPVVRLQERHDRRLPQDAGLERLRRHRRGHPHAQSADLRQAPRRRPTASTSPPARVF